VVPYCSSPSNFSAPTEQNEPKQQTKTDSPRKLVKLKKGTPISVTPTKEISTSSHNAGEVWEGKLTSDLAAEGLIAWKAGAAVKGKVLQSISRNTSKDGVGRLAVALTQIGTVKVAGGTHVVTAAPSNAEAETVKKGAAGAAVGAVVGGAVGLVGSFFTAGADLGQLTMGGIALGGTIGGAVGAKISPLLIKDAIVIQKDSVMLFDVSFDVPIYVSTAVRVTGVSLDKTSLLLGVGEKIKIVPSVQPNNAANKTVSWSSSDAVVATVNDGLVTALQAGKTTITTTTQNGGFRSSCILTVLPTEVRRLMQSAEDGDPNAHYMLGVLSYEGVVAQKNFDDVYTYMRLAATRHNHVAAQYNLSLLYLNGAGVKENAKEAARWMQQSSDQNLPDAQFMLGLMYIYGVGLNRNYAFGKGLITKAAQQGYPQARLFLNDKDRLERARSEGVTSGVVRWWRDDADFYALENNFITNYAQKDKTAFKRQK
jgi:uncharacterized protein YjdB